MALQARVLQQVMAAEILHDHDFRLKIITIVAVCFDTKGEMMYFSEAGHVARRKKPKGTLNLNECTALLTKTQVLLIAFARGV